jgi:HEAT repeat protein
MLQQQIDDEAKRLPWTRGFERLEQIRWFASNGEPAYATLLVLAEDERHDVAAAALAALGATLDRRLVPHIQNLVWSVDRDQGDLSLERARALIRLGDWSQIPVLIDGLKDSRMYTRALCLDALREATHETHGYDPRAEDGERERAIERWESWWSERAEDNYLHG